MTSTYLADHPQRLLATVELTPLQGRRFQPASYANLGPAVFATPDGGTHLQVDGHAAVANWLEAVGWDDADQRPVAALSALPYVAVHRGGALVTSSRTDSHRLASAYVLDGRDGDGTEFRKRLVAEMGLAKKQPIDWPRVAGVVFRYDPLSLLHGVFFSQGEIHGNPKFPRIVSGFVEAENVRPASKGGVRFDRVDPSTEKEAVKRGAEEGYGNVPLPIADDYSADRILLYWSLDRASVAATRLPEPAQRLLEAVGTWQLRRLVDAPIKPRTFCDLRADPPGGLAPLGDLEAEIDQAAADCATDGLFADPLTTVVNHDG